MSNGPEFSWEYRHGGGAGNYSQMGMNSSAPGGGGRQWLHSNQGNTAFMQSHGSQGSGPYASPADPFASYNQSMMNQYTNFKPTYGHSQVGASMVNGMSQEPSPRMGNGMAQSMQMSQGLDGMSQNMGGMRNGLGAMASGQRLAGGYSRRSNGLNDPNPNQNHRGSWF